MDETIFFKMQELIHQYTEENICLWVEIYEDFLKYTISIFNVESSGITIHQTYTINIPFATINKMSDDDIIESIRTFVEEAKTQIKEEK